MTAEQIRDSVLFVSGALDPKIGGPSAPLTPSSTRRTMYGRVSRYKLDEYLQLFDFPSPNLSAEKRFVTTVPLQRLFFLNSDFMQQQGELLAKRVAGEATTTDRVQKAYRLIFGRAATDAEVRAAIQYLSTEPMKEYEERKAAKEAAGQAGQAGGAGQAGSDDSTEPEDKAKDADTASDSMMAGVVPGAEKKDEAKKLLPVTAWGRYLKTLLSSNEFLFVS
jgi:hypothetical protein